MIKGLETAVFRARDASGNLGVAGDLDAGREDSCPGRRTSLYTPRFPKIRWSDHRPRKGRGRTRGFLSMAGGGVVWFLTAVWLVDNTALSFEQIAQFCGLHPLEVKAIA